MAFLSFKKKYDGRLVVLTYEGPGRLLLNGNRTHDEHARRNAAGHAGDCLLDRDGIRRRPAGPRGWPGGDSTWIPPKWSGCCTTCPRHRAAGRYWSTWSRAVTIRADGSS